MNMPDTSLLKKQYDKSRDEYGERLEKMAEEICRILSALPLRYQIRYRLKSFESYCEKLPGLKEADSKGITDFIGVRIICPFLADLAMVEEALESHFSLREIERKGAQISFREFGYDSVHMLLDLSGPLIAAPLYGVEPVLEVQIRTILQDAWAEVEHELVYKAELTVPSVNIRRKLAALNANLTLSDIIFQELRDSQKEFIRKQQKNRDIQNAMSGVFSSEQLKQDLCTQQIVPEARESLEQIIIRALTAHSEENFEQAIKLYSKALKLEAPDTVRSILLNHRGMAYFALSENNAARADFRSALEHDNNNFRAWYNLGLAHKSLSEFKRALDAFQKSASVNPAFTEAATQKIRLHIELGNKEIAAGEFAELKKSQPHDREVLKLEEELGYLLRPKPDNKD